jgi:integrase
MSIKKRGDIWYCDIEIVGQPRIRRSLKTKDKREAQKRHDKLKYSQQHIKDEGKTLSDAIKLWLLERERDNREKSAIKVFLTKYPSRPLSQVNAEDILDATKKDNPSTYNRTISIIQTALTLANKRGYTKPIALVKRKPNSVKMRFLTHDEWARLERELPTHLNLIATFSINTGLRQANALNLQWSQVNLDNAMAWISQTDTKNKKPLGVPLNKKAIEILKSCKGKHKEYVFTYKGEPMTGIKKAWNNALVRANIDVVTKLNKKGKEYTTSTFRWHDLRHTWASWHVQNGTPLAVLKELGGWHSMEMVMRYAHINPSHLKQYADNIVP